MLRPEGLRGQGHPKLPPHQLENAWKYLSDRVRQRLLARGRRELILHQLPSNELRLLQPQSNLHCSCGPLQPRYVLQKRQKTYLRRPRNSNKKDYSCDNAGGLE